MMLQHSRKKQLSLRGWTRGEHFLEGLAFKKEKKKYKSKHITVLWPGVFNLHCKGPVWLQAFIPTKLEAHFDSWLETTMNWDEQVESGVVPDGLKWKPAVTPISLRRRLVTPDVDLGPVWIDCKRSSVHLVLTLIKIIQTFNHSFWGYHTKEHLRWTDGWTDGQPEG